MKIKNTLMKIILRIPSLLLGPLAALVACNT